MAEKTKLTILGKLVIFLFFAGCIYGAWFLFGQKPVNLSKLVPQKSSSSDNAATQQPVLDNTSQKGGAKDGGTVEIGIAYGTEKQRWLTWAADEFAKTPAGQRIKIDLIPMGSLEGAQAALAGDKRINVWSPASALYKDVFVQEWTLKNNGNPIVREDNLALTPMVFVMWAERYSAFKGKYGELNFQTLASALREPGGWDGIAKKPEWGLFKFGHTHPNQSNSGLMALVLMGYDFHKKTRDLSLKDILDPKFQAWISSIETAVSGLNNSTGNMMRDMVLRGPSSYDSVFVYENVAIDFLKNAEGRWGELHVVYPPENMWSDSPYYILNVPWSTQDQRAAAGAFLDFLMSERPQQEALKHGFRPGNPAIPIRFPESPFVQYQNFGLSVDISSTCDAPKSEVIANLLQFWQRAQGTR